MLQSLNRSSLSEATNVRKHVHLVLLTGTVNLLEAVLDLSTNFDSPLPDIAFHSETQHWQLQNKEEKFTGCQQL